MDHDRNVVGLDGIEIGFQAALRRQVMVPRLFDERARRWRVMRRCVAEHLAQEDAIKDVFRECALARDGNLPRQTGCGFDMRVELGDMLATPGDEIADMATQRRRAFQAEQFGGHVGPRGDHARAIIDIEQSGFAADHKIIDREGAHERRIRIGHDKNVFGHDFYRSELVNLLADPAAHRQRAPVIPAAALPRDADEAAINDAFGFDQDRARTGEMRERGHVSTVDDNVMLEGWPEAVERFHQQRAPLQIGRVGRRDESQGGAHWFVVHAGAAPGASLHPVIAGVRSNVLAAIPWRSIPARSASAAGRPFIMPMLFNRRSTRFPANQARVARSALAGP